MNYRIRKCFSCGKEFEAAGGSRANCHQCKPTRGRPKQEMPNYCKSCHKPTTKDDYYGRAFRCCKVCLNLRHTELQSVKRATIKLKAVKYKGSKCFRCGGLYPLGAYQFHHPGAKDIQISDALLMLPWQLIQLELDQCILLCANCHALEHCKHDLFLRLPK